MLSVRIPAPSDSTRSVAVLLPVWYVCMYVRLCSVNSFGTRLCAFPMQVHTFVHESFAINMWLWPHSFWPSLNSPFLFGNPVLLVTYLSQTRQCWSSHNIRSSTSSCPAILGICLVSGRGGGVKWKYYAQCKATTDSTHPIQGEARLQRPGT